MDRDKILRQSLILSGLTETTIRMMSNLRDRGIIQPSRGQIVILDEAKLRLLSEGPPWV